MLVGTKDGMSSDVLRPKAMEFEDALMMGIGQRRVFEGVRQTIRNGPGRVSSVEHFIDESDELLLFIRLYTG